MEGFRIKCRYVLKRGGFIYAFASGLFLTFIAILPTVAHIFLSNQPSEMAEGSSLVMATLTGAGLLVLVGVLTDVKRQIRAYLQMRKSDIKNWTLCYTTIDEIEANIKKVFGEQGNTCGHQALSVYLGHAY